MGVSYVKFVFRVVRGQELIYKALFRYFDQAPGELFVKAEAK